MCPSLVVNKCYTTIISIMSIKSDLSVDWDLDGYLVDCFRNENSNDVLKTVESTQLTVKAFKTLMPNQHLSPVIINIYGILLTKCLDNPRIRIFDVETYANLDEEKKELYLEKNKVPDNTAYWNLRIEWDILLFPRCYGNQFSLVVVDFKDNTIVDYNSNVDVSDKSHLTKLSNWLNEFEETSPQPHYNYTVSSSCPKQTSSFDSGVFTILAMHSLLSPVKKYNNDHINCARLCIARTIHLGLILDPTLNDLFRD